MYIQSGSMFMINISYSSRTETIDLLHSRGLLSVSPIESIHDKMSPEIQERANYSSIDMKIQFFCQ